VGVFGSAREALRVLDVESIDVMFMDIDMPELSGLEFRK
jgi:YesN/AraC family two-component response regulator